jgi:hypothetical protein
MHLPANHRARITSVQYLAVIVTRTGRHRWGDSSAALHAPAPPHRVRPLSAEEARDAGIVNTVGACAEVDAVALKAAQEIAALPAGVVAVARRLMRGRLDDVVERINTETMHFKEFVKSDEARAAFAAFLARKK